MTPPTKRTTAVVTGSALFSAAFISAPDLLPFLDPTGWLPLANTTLMLVTVGLAAPAGMGYAVWMLLDYVATREDVRVVRRAEPEPQLREDLVG